MKLKKPLVSCKMEEAVYTVTTEYIIDMEYHQVKFRVSANAIPKGWYLH